MNTFILTIDLNDPKKDYKKLYALLEYFDHIRMTDSQYMIHTDKTLGTVFSLVKYVTDEDDAFTINDFQTALANLPNKVWWWLSQRISVRMLGSKSLSV